MACHASEAWRSGGRHAGPGGVSKRVEALHEEVLRRSGRPRLPTRKPVPRKRIVEKRGDLDAERLDHIGSAPADDVERLRGGSDTIGPLVLRVGLRGPWQQLIARVDGGLQASLAKWLAELRLQRRDAIPTKHEKRP